MTTGDWERSVHPDLVDDEPAEGAPGRAPGAGARRSPTSPPASDAPSSDTPISDDGAEPVSPETGDQSWFEQVREATDPVEALRLIAKNIPREQLEKDEVMSGLIGQIGDRRARDLLAKQQRDAEERAKLEAAANNDLYTLGELTQRDMQQQIASQQASQALAPAMDAVVLFQRTLPESVQKDVSGKAFGVGKTPAEGLAEYMEYVSEQRVKLELSKRESALRKSLMSDMNGDEPVPERDSGTPGRVREVTDEQIANMSLAEYEALFDENGRPKPGVRHRSTRGIPVHRQ